MIKRTLCFSNPCYLSTKDEQLIIKWPEANNKDLPEVIRKEAAQTVPIEDIGVVVLDCQQLTITSSLMEKLTENNVAIISCDNCHLPIGLMLPLCGGNTVQTKRQRQQIESSLPLRKQLWQQTVQQKIANQATVLSEMRNAEIKNMRQWQQDVKSGDSDNKEARAAAYYWRNMFPEIDGFVRSREGVFPNNLLNYGYAIVRAVIARALVAAGLLPTLGLHHRNKYNAYCLADDIMEPYRPVVDKIVIELYEKDKENKEIDKERKISLLSIPTKEVKIGGVRSPLLVAASTTASSLHKCFAGEARKIIYPEL